MNLTGKNIVVGVTGGIAAYKTCTLVSTLTKLGASVKVIMTKNATQFVSPLTFETLSGARVISDMFDRDFPWEIEHISLAKKADIFVVCPCSANALGKFACGIADDFLSTTIMAVKSPILLAPAMNTNMLHSAVTQQNIATLKTRGAHFVNSGIGRLACGDVGDGRMAEPEEILAAICEILEVSDDYKDKTVLITAGATIEPIDPVRYITNRSSGKMGIELAKAALHRGARVILVAGHTSVSIPDGVTLVNVETTSQMLDAVLANLPKADIIIKAAAPSDYCVDKFYDQKIKSQSLTLNLKKNPDIAKQVGERKGDKKLVIFSAETENLIANATAKLKNKNADMVIANDVTLAGAGFDVDTNICTIITVERAKSYPIMPKAKLANVILDAIKEI